jgi:hypothetical protein
MLSPNSIDSLADINDRIAVAHELKRYAAKIEHDSLQHEADFKLGILLLISQNDSALYYLGKAKEGFKKNGYTSRVIAANGGFLN